MLGTCKLSKNFFLNGLRFFFPYYFFIYFLHIFKKNLTNFVWYINMIQKSKFMKPFVFNCTFYTSFPGLAQKARRDDGSSTSVMSNIRTEYRKSCCSMSNSVRLFLKTTKPDVLYPSDGKLDTPNWQHWIWDLERGVPKLIQAIKEQNQNF